MQHNNSFSQEILEKFQQIDSKLYNLKYCLEMFINYIEDEADASLSIVCLGLIIKHYFNTTKEEFNKLEEELGVLI